MVWRSPKSFSVRLRGFSLRRRIALSLTVVRVVLAPVIFLAVYYLFAMASIVERIVNVDAPVATNAERASVEMLDARRAEANYFLLHDPDDVTRNRQSMDQLEKTVQLCRRLQPEERPALDAMAEQTAVYRRSFNRAVERLGETHMPPLQSLRQVVRTYEQDLDEVLAHSANQNRTQVIETLRARIESFDTEIEAKVEENDPQFRQTSRELGAAANKIVSLSTELEGRSWQRVERDHHHARVLLIRAEVVGGIVSAITLLVSIWISFTLPRQVVQPLTDLKQAVDHAAAGNYEVTLALKGEGEVVELAASLRNLIAHLRERKDKG